MISYTDGKESGVLTTKKIDKDFVKSFKSEAEMINNFTEHIKKNDYDIIAGYNSSNFDVPYLTTRASATKASFERWQVRGRAQAGAPRPA